MTGLPDTAGMREALAEALRDELVRLDEWPTGLELADVVLPVVQRLAAKELRAAADEPPALFGDDDADDYVKDHIRDWLHDRADALTAATYIKRNDDK